MNYSDDEKNPKVSFCVDGVGNRFINASDEGYACDDKSWGVGITSDDKINEGIETRAGFFKRLISWFKQLF